SATFLAVFAELLEAAPPAWRGRLTNAFEAVSILSLAIGGALGAVIAGRAGWRPVFVGAGPVLLVTAVFWPFLDSRAGRASPVALADRVGAPLSPAHLATYRMAMDMGMIAGPLVLGGLASLAGDRLAVGAAGFVLLAGALALARW